MLSVLRPKLTCFMDSSSTILLTYNNKTAGEEEAWRQLHKNVASNIKQVLAATPHKAPTIRKLSKLDEPDMQDTAGGAGTSS